MSAHTASPRVAPGDRDELRWLDELTVRVLGAATGVDRPNLFATLGRHRRLYRPWLRFAAALMPGGALPRVDAELVILRTAHNCACTYEVRHHELLARQAGLTDDDVARVANGPAAEEWSERQRVLLAATDELHADRDLSVATWTSLQVHLDQTQLIELPMLVGHYEMLAMTLNSLRVQPDPVAGPRGLFGRAVHALAARRQ